MFTLKHPNTSYFVQLTLFANISVDACIYKSQLTKKSIIGMIFLPVLFSCSTLDYEAHVNHNEQPKKIVTTPIPVAIDYGKLIKITSSADVLFDSASAELKTNDIHPLNNFAKELQNLPNNIKVVVYTDRIGSEHYNKKLSLRRAETVKIYMISKGIEPNRIFIDGKGEANPVTGNTCDENLKREALIGCLSLDRRVEIDVIDVAN